MRTQLISVAATLAALTAASSATAHADPIQIGVGARTSLAFFGPATFGASLSLRDHYGELEITGSDSAEDGSAPSQRTHWLSLAILPVVARRGAATLEVGLRASAIDLRGTDPEGNAYGSDALAVDAPIRIDVAVAPWLSLLVEGSVQLWNNGGAPSSGVVVNGPYNLAGGFTVWF